MIKNNNLTLFSYLGLFFIGFNFLAILLAIAGVFYKAIFTVYILLGILWFIYAIWKKKVLIKIKKDMILATVLALLFILILSCSTTPTIFSGRDQGSFSEAAIRLSQNHQLKFSSPASDEFFKIYGPGLALDFPGFNYAPDGKLITHFSLGYIAYLAAFYSFFGLNGLIAANAATFFIFLLSFYWLARQYLKTFSAFAVCLLIITSFIFSWFFKFTLSENLALALIWLGILELVLFLNKKDKLFFYTSLLAFFLLLFVRIEASAFLAMLVLVIFIVHRKQNKTIFFLLDKKILITVAILFLFYLANVWTNFDFYKVSAKGFLHSFSGGTDSSNGFFLNIFYIFRVLSAYSLLGFLLAGLGGIAYFIWQKRYFLLVPFFIVLPAFLYLIQPGISMDHPWMLRRFVFAVAPVCIFYTGLFLDQFLKRKVYFYFLVLIFLAVNLTVFLPYLTFSENKNLLPQIKKISDNFKPSDLVLIDRNVSGSGWAMPTGPMSFLYGKQAVYLVNPADIDKIDISRFHRVYLMLPEDALGSYTPYGLLNRIRSINDYALETERLDIKIGGKKELYLQKVGLPTAEKKVIYGKIYSLK